ncbi:cytochrome P450 714C2-like [Aristolochia californica]|uniref:cytochrome P450 714C2-like n=1 Tax=Aristolochia californica TaxID=171875 RepID=UPI0035E1E46D
MVSELDCVRIPKEAVGNENGHVFTFSIGVVPILHIVDSELAKDLILMKTIDLGKSFYLRKNREVMLGNGVMASSGMTNMMLESLETLTDNWEKRLDSTSGVVDMNVDPYLRAYTADVISKACFESSFNEGREIFSQLKTLQIALNKQTGDFGIPGLRYIPKKSNREAWRMDKEIRLSIVKVIKEREISNRVHQSCFGEVPVVAARAYGALMQSGTAGGSVEALTTHSLYGNKMSPGASDHKSVS